MFSLAVGALLLTQAFGYSNPAISQLNGDLHSNKISAESAILNLADYLDIDEDYRLEPDTVLLPELQRSPIDDELVIIISGVDDYADILPLQSSVDVGSGEISTFIQFVNGISNKFDETVSRLIKQDVAKRDSVINHDLNGLKHVLASNANAIFRVDALSDFARTAGVDSESYKAAKEAITNVLRSTGREVLVVTTPPFDFAQEITKREVKGTFNSFSCFKTQDACIQNTNTCSNHGICSKVGDCYKCLCTPSKDAKGSTISWSGFNCAKKDYAVEFNLFLWSGIILVALLVAGVKLLISIGNEPMPGVLLAATSAKKAN
ncbi:Hypothetical protein PAS_chr2-1_0341 [Komagataella phaffii GS115]|uniref:Vacuolar sorting protein Vps3844 C-terminal domain-containing protein n=1 Tax=Komagataella phaffii (strain GS115 / ATCC 20864) TaxID=644223 RepID=C4R0D6_KOMPG|nr:Hypothetical protein PAS_chr2-1_0341 [Komagataella phaffii GS115]AOA67215.1 GQ68_01010T0 [Komagataella phaffii GS115]CAY68960.1 Hypothetical protein PAS_chr2-1_0341 [Komagataella phaffii GS115]